ncbi:MAG: ABC transporter permease [Filifactoraceae bacterium]
MNPLLITSLEQGLIFSILSIGVYITYKILDFPDLSVEGTFPLGAFVFAKFALLGFNPIISTLLAALLGSLSGVITYTLHIKLKIKPILAGILTMTILYSVNLRIHENKANIPLYNVDSIFSLGQALIVLSLIVLIVKLLMDLFLKTELGYLLIATGDNESLIKSLGVNPNKMKLIGLIISNGIVALSGALMAQSQGFSDVNMGTSIIVAALASIIIGDSFIKNSSMIKGTTRAIIGAVAYKLIGGFAISLGLPPTDLKAISALIVIIFIIYNNLELNSSLPQILTKKSHILQ